MTVNLTVLYGSETGTAQDTAEQIWRDAKRFGLRCTVAAMDDYNIENLISERLIVFVVATTGQGEPPSNMRRFWRFLLRKNLPKDSLVNTRYAVLGLGDSSYLKFNFAAKRLNNRLTQLGGIELTPIGLADDQHDLGIDATIGPWIEELWNKIAHILDIPRKTLISKSNDIIERFHVNIIGMGHVDVFDDTNHLDNNIYKCEKTHLDNALKIGTVIENVRTTSDDHFQDVRLIKFQAQEANYVPGDVLYMRPKNSVKQVNKFFAVLNNNGVQVHPNTMIRVSEKEIKVPTVLNQELALRQIVEQYWDLNFEPRRSTIQMLASISEDELEKDKLIEFTTPNGQEELYNYVNRPRRNIVEFLADFPHTTGKLTVQLLFEIMSPIKPRAFSIASSLKHTKDEVHILVAVVKYKTKLVEPRLGLCSNWITTLNVGDEVIFWIQKGTFRFNYDKPMILIGPGTGIAPFRALLFERATLNKDLSNCILFFGCRYKEKDYHFKEDLEYLSKEYNLKLFCAFSRDQDHKVYVQHVIREQSKLCWNFLQNGASIYLAGSSKNMPNSVREEFVRIVKNFGNLTEEEAKNIIKQLENDSRYQIETWV